MLKLIPRGEFLISTLIILLSTILLSIISLFLTNSKVDCKIEMCDSIYENQSILQHIDFTFVNQNREKLLMPHKSNSVEITRNQKNIVFLIPQMKPEVSNLEVELKNIRENAKIRVIIEQSRSIYMFVDGQIAFTHRYEIPVFQVNPKELAIYNGIDDSSQRIESNYIIKNPKWQEISRAVLMPLILFSSILVFSLMYRRKSISAMGLETGRTYFYSGVAIFWIVSTTTFFVQPFDPVGAQNPGLFGPIGAAFSDYFQISQIGQFDKPYEYGGVNYPPTALLFGKILHYILPGLPGFMLLASSTLGSIFRLLRSNGAFNSARSALPFIFFYPLVFGLVRGNFDIVAVCLVLYSINLIDRSGGHISTFLLAVAVSIKIWPIVFVLYLCKWKNKKLLFETLVYIFILTLLSAYFLGYTRLDKIYEIVFSSFVSADNVTTQAFRYCFSVTAIIFFIHLLITAVSPWDPQKSEINNSVIFADGLFAKAILLAILILLLVGVLKTKDRRQSFLLLSGIVLLLPTPSYTYRGAILLGYFILFNHGLSWDCLKERKSYNLLRKFQLSMWIPIFAPSTFFFASSSEISTASFIQPLSLSTILGIELYFLFSERPYFQSKRLFSRITS